MSEQNKSHKKEEKLYDAITQIDDGLISEAEGKTSGANKNMFKGLLTLAACIVIFVILCIPLSSVFQKMDTTKSESASQNYGMGDTDENNASKGENPLSDNGEVENEESAAGTNNETTKQNPYFNATVLEVNENSVLVEPFEGTDERNSSDKITVSIKVVSTNPVPEMKKGDKIRIVYNGDIAETYPAQISTVFAIYALDSEGNVIFISNE